jgi:hypothetical protein
MTVGIVATAGAVLILLASNACNDDGASAVLSLPASTVVDANTVPRPSATSKASTLDPPASTTDTALESSALSSQPPPRLGPGPIEQMKLRARTSVTDYLGKSITIEGLYRRTTVRMHGGGEHLLYRFTQVLIADSKQTDVVLACESETLNPPNDLREHDPVIVEGTGMALAGRAEGYDLYLAGCSVKKR